MKMGKQNIYYINRKEKEVIKKYFLEAIKQINKEQIYLEKKGELVEWSKLHEDKYLIEKFLERISLVKVIKKGE